MSLLYTLILKHYYRFYHGVHTPFVRLKYKWHPPFIVKSAIETLDYIIKERVSVSRFGDGEFIIMNNKGMGFQDANELLGKRLIEVLRTDRTNHISCLPFPLLNQENLLPDIARYWRRVLANYHVFLESICNKKLYYDACFTRFYIDYVDKSNCSVIIDKLKALWDNQDVFIVEGDSTLFGIDNDFLSNTKSIHRIVCPSKNAFSKYDTILTEIIKHVPKHSLVLIALGMTATVLSYDLAKIGYWAIDIGHADLEYMWYKMGATQRTKIEGKAVNELGIPQVSPSTNTEYLNQIIVHI